MWSELGLFMTMAEEKKIPDTGCRLFFFFFDHDAYMTVHITLSFLIIFSPLKFILFVFETVGIDCMAKFL